MNQSKTNQADQEAGEVMAIGPYESQGHRDRCALTGLLVMRVLNMQDSSPNEVSKRVEDMQLGLRIIATWAACDGGSQQTRFEAMQDIEQRANESLRKE